LCFLSKSLNLSGGSSGHCHWTQICSNDKSETKIQSKTKKKHLLAAQEWTNRTLVSMLSALISISDQV